MTAWIFDIDGVLTNLLKEKIEQEEIIDEIDKRLKKGEVVALVTGRGFWWLEENIFPKIERIIEDKSLHNKLFIMCEFGGVTARITEGRIEKEIDEETRVPEKAFDRGYKILESYRDTTEKEAKDTLFTLRIKPGTDIKKFKSDQAKIEEELKEMLIDLSLDTTFEVHADAIGINIRHKRSNKMAAVQKLLKWIQENHENPENYIVFGDSRSDFEMGEELTRQGKNFNFVYVGEDTEEYPSFMIYRPKERYDKGTLEYLREN